MNHPETRPSLLIRLRDREDAAAWEEFVDIYRPVIVRVAQMRGMQPADAEDLAQHVLLLVSKAIERFDPERTDAKFRTWLRRIADNAILNALSRGYPDRGSGDSDLHALLHQRPSADDPQSTLLTTEVRREVFQLAARIVREEFSPATWAAFWRTAVDEQDVGEVAQELGRSTGSVYASRSRVMKRLRQQVEHYQRDDQS